MMSKLKSLTLFCALLTIFLCTGETKVSAQSKDSYVAGIVRDRVTDEPLVGVAIYFEGKSYGSLTNENGYYPIIENTSIPPPSGLLIE